MATQSYSQRSSDADWCSNIAQTESIGVRNGDQIYWLPSIGDDGLADKKAAANLATAVVTLTRCTLSGGNAQDQTKTITITGTAGQTWSATIVYTHAHAGYCSGGNKTKTFTISGTVLANAVYGMKVQDASGNVTLDTTDNPKTFQELVSFISVRLWPEDRCADGTYYSAANGFPNTLVVDCPGVTSQADLDANYFVERRDRGIFDLSGSYNKVDYSHRVFYHSTGKIKFRWGRGDGGISTPATGPDMKCYGGQQGYPIPSSNDCACNATDDLLSYYRIYAINKDLALVGTGVDSHGINVKTASGKTVFSTEKPSSVAVHKQTVNGSFEAFPNNYFKWVSTNNQYQNASTMYKFVEWHNGQLCHVPPHVAGDHLIKETGNTVLAHAYNFANRTAVYSTVGITSYQSYWNYWGPAGYYPNVGGTTGGRAWPNQPNHQYTIGLQRKRYVNGAWQNMLPGWADGYRYTNSTVNGNKLYLSYLGPVREEMDFQGWGDSLQQLVESPYTQSNVPFYEIFDWYECNEDISSLRGTGNKTLYETNLSSMPDYWNDYYIRPTQSSGTTGHGSWHTCQRVYFRTFHAHRTGWNNSDVSVHRPRFIQVCDGNPTSNSTRNQYEVVFTVNSFSFTDMSGNTGIVNSPTGTTHGIHVQTSNTKRHQAASYYTAQQMVAFTTKTRVPVIEVGRQQDLVDVTTTTGNLVSGSTTRKRYCSGRFTEVRDVTWSGTLCFKPRWIFNSNNNIAINVGSQDRSYNDDRSTFLGPTLGTIVNFGDGM